MTNESASNNENVPPQTSGVYGLTQGVNDTSTSINHNNKDSGGTNKSRANRRGNTSKYFLDISNNDFEGETPEIGCVVGLKSEKIAAKVQFDTFRDKVSDYILRELTNGMDVVPYVKDMEDPSEDFVDRFLPQNLTLSERQDDVKKGLFDQKLKKYVDREYLMYDNRVKLYTYVWGQCSSGVRSVIMGEELYKQKHGKKDILWLLEKIKLVTAGLDSKNNKYENMYDTMMTFLTMRQGETESNSAYLERFKSNAETVRLMCGSDFFVSREVMGKAFYTSEEIQESNEKLHAMIMIKRSCNKRFGDLKRRLREACDLGRDEYPTTIAGAYDLLVRTQDQIRASYGDRSVNKFQGGDRSKVMFSQVDDSALSDAVLVAGLDGTTNPKMTCWHCNKPGHGRDNCPYNPAAANGQGGNRRGVKKTISNLMIGFGFMQNKRRTNEEIQERYSQLPSSWILLDTCSTVDVTNNPEHVENIVPCSEDQRINIVTNGGSMRYHHMADLKLFPIKVHFNEFSMATIISLASLLDLNGYYAKMDSRHDFAIHVFTPHGKMYKFKQCNDGLYYFDTSRADLHVFNYSNDELLNYSHFNMLQTVANNKEFLTEKEIEGADYARREQELIGWPSTTTYKKYITNNLLNNTKTTIDDVNRALYIHGEPEPILEGKMTRPRSRPFGKIKRIPLPLPIKENYSHIQIHVDFFFVNKIPFLHTKSEKLNFLTVEKMNSRTKGAIIGSILDTIKIYTRRGFEVSFMHGDREFNMEDLKSAIAPTEAIIYGKNEHVPVVERSVRTIKERCRVTCRAAPYTRYTSLMVKYLVQSRVSWLNKFPSENGISKDMSPAAIVLGQEKPDMSIKRIPFGSYALVYSQTSNDMKTRSVPGIALGEANEKGGHYFMSLYTGKRIHGYSWKEVPIHQDVIDTVEQFAKDEDQPSMIDREPLFEWAPGVSITDDENDETSYSEANDDNSFEDENELENVVEDNEQNLVTDDDVESSEQESDNDSEEEATIEDDLEEINYEHDENNDNPLQEESFIAEDLNEEEKLMNDDVISESEERNNLNDNATRRSTRNNAGSGVERFEPRFNEKTYELTRKRQYLQFKRKKRHVQLTQVKGRMQKVRKDAHAPSYLQKAVNIIFTQLEEDEKKFKDMPAHKGMKIFGERAIAACLKEFTQLSEGVMPGKPVVISIDPTKITNEEKRKALEAVNLIKQKRCGKIKFRSCANGSEQWKFLREDENISSPTLQLKSLFISMMIDVFERRDVAIFDIPGAYLHAEMPEDKMVLMRFRGQFAELMSEVNHEHKKNIILENGKKVLYVRVVRAIYGCIKSAMLWYNLYVDTLKELGFELNPYDKCVANKLINGSQCTMCWYVDDNKLSHKDPNVVQEVLDKISSRFGDLSITRGDNHVFLGMKLSINRKNKTSSVNMSDQVMETVQAFGEEVNGSVTSPAAKYLLNVPDEDEELDDERKERFHSVVAKLLYIMKRARPDLEPAVAFLCTRVSKCAKSDWGKLKRILQYAKSTKDDVRIIGATKLTDIFTFVDASYAVYDNMRGVTGGCMSMGIGVFHARSSKQKLNTKSSTETELVGVSEYLPFNIWAVQFLKEQGYEITKNILYQDNHGAMLMERNGRNSCTGNSRYINVRYFFVKDRIDKKEIALEYCPTYLMVADFFTKPLQGRMFKIFRDVVMGYRNIQDVISEIPIKERVGNVNKNRNVSKNKNEMIGMSKDDIRDRVLNNLTATKQNTQNCHNRRKVRWNDETEQDTL